jgi:hypothetical protein
MNKFLRSYLQHRVLSHRFSGGLAGPRDNSTDTILRIFEATQGSDEEASGALKLQNVCAKIPVYLVNRLDANLSVLSMSKREFVEVAIVAALDEVDRIYEENEMPAPQYDGGTDELSESRHRTQ